MYYSGQTSFSDGLPVSVTMEDDSKYSQSDSRNRDDGDKPAPRQQAARLLQVTISAGDTEGKEETECNISRSVADASSVPSDGIGASSTVDDDDEYILQQPGAATGNRTLERLIELDSESLSEIERQQVGFDLRDEIFPSPIKSSYLNTNSSVPKSDLELLNRELFSLLEDPEEQQRNPVYAKIAEKLSSSDSNLYANSIDFRTKLLRAEHNDVRKAAKRTADYLAILWDSFGETLLSRPILLSDLSVTERQLQRKGYQQLFRFRDQSQYRISREQKEGSDQEEKLEEPDNGAGRRIAGSFDLCRCINTIEPATENETLKTRVLLYLMQVASDDEETQTQGIVFIFMLALRAVTSSLPTTCPPATTTIPMAQSQAQQKASGGASPSRRDSDNIFANDSNSDSDNQSDEQLLAQLQFSPHEISNRHNHTISRIRVLSKVFRCCLIRVAAIHVCSPNRPELQSLKIDFLKSLDRQERVRTRFHNGTSMECSLSLNKVGIPTDRLPLKYDGTIKTEDHSQWIAIQEAKESAAKQNRSFNIVECPLNMDVLSGRGQLVRSHPGNVSFRKDFIRARSARYDMAANREQKNAIADEILEDISTLQRRFLKQHQGAGYWTELDKKTAKEKVMMAFREFRKSQRNQLQQKQIRTAQRQQHVKQPSSLHQARPSLPLSGSVHNSPVIQSPVDSRQTHPLTMMHHDEAVQSQQPPIHMEPHQQVDFHYQPYPPISSSAAVPGAPGESFHHPQHHVAVPPPAMPFYMPHPQIPPPPPHHPLAYGHHLPPHLLPLPLHHPYPPLPPHDTHVNRGINPPTDRSENNRRDVASALPAAMPLPPAPHGVLMGYPPNYLPPINADLNNRGGVGEVDSQHRHRPPSQQRGNNEDDIDEDTGGRSYKRYRTI